MVCVTWHDESRTIKIAIPSVAFNREQLEAFQRLFEAYSLFSKAMKSKSLLKIYLFSLVILYKHYKPDAEADKVTPHVSSYYGSFCAFYLYGVYCNGWQTDCFDNLTAKGFNPHWCKSNLGMPVLCKITGKLHVFDVSAQIQTDMYVLELRAYMLEFMLTVNNSF